MTQNTMDGRSDGVVVETERTWLRPHRYSDLDDVAALWAEPAVVEYIMPAPLARSQSWTRLLRYAGHWAMLPYGYWVVEDKRTGAFLGEVGFADWKREISPSVEGLPELGWIIKPSAQGLGLATETVAAALEWADSQIDANETVALITPEHAASIRVARKTGFGEPETGVFGTEPILIFRRALKSPAPPDGTMNKKQGQQP